MPRSSSTLSPSSSCTSQHVQARLYVPALRVPRNVQARLRSQLFVAYRLQAPHSVQAGLRQFQLFASARRLRQPEHLLLERHHALANPPRSLRQRLRKRRHSSRHRSCRSRSGQSPHGAEQAKRRIPKRVEAEGHYWSLKAKLARFTSEPPLPHEHDGGRSCSA